MIKTTTKTVCDFCGIEEGLVEYIIPRQSIVEARGGRNKAKLIEFTGSVIPYHIDLCETCATKFARYIQRIYQYELAEGDKNAWE